MVRMITIRRCVGLAFVVSLLTLAVLAQDKPAGKKKWTFAEAKTLLERSPRDTYLQYVTLLTAKREKIGADQLYFMQNLNRTLGRREGIDLFNTFSGALAIQESLQLDAMLEGQNDTAIAAPDVLVQPAPQKEPEKDRPFAAPARPVETKKPDPTIKVKVASLTGPTIQSHPWEKMLAGRKADVGTLATCVPDDFYFIEFGSAAKLMDALATTDLWTGHLFAQMLGSAQSQDVEKRLKQQLGIQGIPPGLLDAVGLKGIAITGSDLYLADGTDVTLLVQGEKLVQLRQTIDGLTSKQPGVQRTDGKYLDFNYTLTAKPDRSVHVYAADPRPDLHVRSTSLPAFQKVLAAIAGKNDKGEAVKRLGDSAEFAYIRTILPRTAQEEDGLVYLSDPFIRRLLGPQVKLTQQHRLRAYNHLKMIERAALMFRSDTGRAPKSFAELAAAGCAPGIFGEGKWACPAGGKYILSDDGMSARSTIFGTCGQMTPLLEIPLETVSQVDADAYKMFLDNYNQYWRTFFDPIAVRIKVRPEQFRLETVVLPLIDNSIYTGLAQSVGGKTIALASLPVPPKTVHSITAHVNKAPLLQMLPVEPGDDAPPGPASSPVNSLTELILAAHDFHADYNRLPYQAIRTREGKPLLSWRVMLLPYLGEDELYKQFRMEEPWDSDHNKKLIEKMPKLFSSGNAELDKAYKTRLLAPVGDHTVFPPTEKDITLGKVTAGNGTSNTIAFVEAASEKAVVWTKPDDLVIDWKNPVQGLVGPDQADLLVAGCDGVVYKIKSPVDSKKLATCLQWRDAANPAALSTLGQAQVSAVRSRRGPGPGSALPNLNLKLLRQFIEQGIGDQISYQVLDASQPITSDVSGFFGSEAPMGGLFGRNMFGTEMIVVGLFAQSLTNPICVSIPVNNADIVDRFLVEVDQRLAELPKSFEQFIRTEKYQVKLNDKTVRVWGVKIFGFNFRVAWVRLGNWLVLTNQPTMLEELAGFYSKLPAQPAVNDKAVAGDNAGHAQFRIRPEAWNAVLPGYQLGWEENHRAACEINQQQIASLARGYPELVSKDGATTPELLQRVNQVYGTRPYCPDAGTYRITPEGQCECSVHGMVHVNPRQLLAPAPTSDTVKSLAHFKGMAATLTFLEDGLHAVVTIERK